MKKVLFVCSGNTCRSPMAQGIFNTMASKEGVEAQAFSAGLYTIDGLEYSPNTILVLSEDGIELIGESRQITEEMLEECDYAFGLTNSLGAALAEAFPQFSEKIYCFPVEVPDPFGSDLVIYKRCFMKITEGVKEIINTIKAREK